MITVYSKPDCGQCTATYRALESKNIDYTVVDLASDAEALAKVKELGYMSAPVVVVDDNHHWAGSRPDQIAKINRRDHAPSETRRPEADPTAADNAPHGSATPLAYTGGITHMTSDRAVIAQSSSYHLTY